MLRRSPIPAALAYQTSTSVQTSPRYGRPSGVADNVPYRTYVEAAKERTTTENGVFSAKLHWYQFAWLCGRLFTGPEADDGSSAEMLNRWFPNLRYIFLWRRDTARQAISYYRASVSQVWFLADNAHHAALAEGDLAEGDFELQRIRWFEDVLLEHRDNWRTYFVANDITPLEVVYEDLVLDYRVVVHGLLKYLGAVESAVMDFPPPILRRQSDDRTEAILESSWLRATSWRPSRMASSGRRQRKGSDPTPMTARAQACLLP